MVDVFISYARDDRALAEGMAELLKAAGHSVWWDRDLGGGEAFSDVIERNLREAKSVVVLWTDASIKSLFVRDEAGRAAAAGKLVPVRTADVSVSRLPVGFGAYHTLLLSERDEIRRAVARLTGRPWEEPEESSFSAARKAASRYYYARRWPLLTSSALALAGGLMWLAIFAKGEPACEGVPVREISSSMWNNIQLNYLDNAQSRAEQLLRCDAASVSGLSGLGSIGFYKGEYPQAAAMFEKALATRPKDFILTLNLADAEVELGHPAQALERYASIDNASTSVRYKMARAHLLAGNPEKAKALAEKVPLSFAEEARPGKARIIEAAALVMMASNLAGGERDALILAAKTSFLEGVRQDAPYWSGIIAGGARNLQEPFDKVVALLGPWAAQWLDEMRPKAG